MGLYRFLTKRKIIVLYKECHVYIMFKVVAERIKNRNNSVYTQVKINVRTCILKVTTCLMDDIVEFMSS